MSEIVASAPASAPAVVAVPVTFEDVYTFSANAKSVTHLSKKYNGEPNVSLRGNFRFFGIALAKGILLDALAYANPNRSGRQSCLDYTSERFGALSIYTTSKGTFVRISDKAVRDLIVEAVPTEEAVDVLNRILVDYNECRVLRGEAFPSRKKG